MTISPPSAPHHTALIVGGSSGIGLAVAEKLHGGGTSVILVGSKESKLSDASNILSAKSPKDTTATVTLWQADLSTTEGRESVVSRVASLDDSVSIRYLVNSAAVFGGSSFEETDEAAYDACMSTNKATFFITQAVVKHVKSVSVSNEGTERCSVVNIGSVLAEQAIKGYHSMAYSMAKAALHAMTRHAAVELADAGIRVNAVAPAAVATPMHRPAGSTQEEFDGKMNALGSMLHPMGRVGQAGEVASVIHFLLTDAAWVTGSVWDVDGGFMAARV